MDRECVALDVIRAMYHNGCWPEGHQELGRAAVELLTNYVRGNGYGTPGVTTPAPPVPAPPVATPVCPAGDPGKDAGRNVKGGGTYIGPELGSLLDSLLKLLEANGGASAPPGVGPFVRHIRSVLDHTRRTDTSVMDARYAASLRAKAAAYEHIREAVLEDARYAEVIAEVVSCESGLRELAGE